MIRKLYKFLGVSALVLFTCIVSNAQRQQVSGTIKDQSGNPMPGVNILLKGTTNGTSSDADGKFAVQASPDDVLQISFIGYKSLEVSVGNQTTIDITMEEDLTTLSEVVVVGYGEQKKALNTGANLQVKGDELQKLSTNNVLQALQGQTPGVQITTTSGQPGSGIRVVIRGQGSINGSGPLYVVDGVLMGDISFLSPSDIESIDVMKDAASAAIYGSQGANGVVLVTTKRGKGVGKSQLTFDAFYGVQNVSRKMPMLNAQEYAAIMNEASVNSGGQPFFTAEELSKIGSDATDWSNSRLDSSQFIAMNGGTNWVDKIFEKNVPTQNYALGLTGGTETSTYSSGLSYQSQAGIIGGKANSNYERYNFRFNSDHKLYGDVLRFGQTLNFAYTKDNGIQVGGIYGNSVLPALQVSPFLPMYDSAGNFWNNLPNSKWNPGEGNPYAQMVLTNQRRNNSQRIVGNIFLELQPIKNLKLRTQLSMDAGNSDGHSFTPVYRLSQYSGNDTTTVSQNMGKYRNLIWDNVLTYTFNVSDNHHFEVMAGTSAIAGSSVGMYGSNYNLTFNTLDKAWLNNSLNKTRASKMGLSGGPGDDDRVLSYYGRLHYNFKETYLLNATFRADGSSKFAPGHRWGYFPSVSAGWVLTNENLMSGLTNIFDNLKLRASWGQVGNRSIPANRYLSPLIYNNGNYPFGGEGSLTPGAYQKRLSNPEVRWETSEQTNIGFDASLLLGKIAVAFDWYTKSSKDWLVQPPVLATAGAEGPWINGGNVTNKGIELMLSYSNQIGSLRYTVSGNGAYNTNRVTQIPTQDGIIYGESNALFVNSEEFYRAQTGYPLGYFYGYKSNGIFQTEEDVASYRNSEGKIIQPNAQAGDLRYVDKDDNGVIDAEDKMMLGNPNPKYTFGVNVQLNYKGFDFAVVGNGVAGNEIAQSYRNPGGYQNFNQYMLGRWHGPGSSNTLPRLDLEGTNYVKFSDIYLQKGDFLRISNVTLGYDFSKLLKVKGFSQLRLYASALNLFTFTKYTGMDPEIGYGPSGDSGRYASGIDLGYYPRPRTYLVGLNVKF
jgi:TonB-dependent starch-binding outer membrane protein SusC